MTVAEVISGVIRKTGAVPIPEEKTCDRLIAGSLDTQVKKIAVTFMATVDVIRQAAREGVNLIITHEPTWFTGEDSPEWLADDPVYVQKKALLDKYQIAVWRFHDHMHMGTEDGIYRGFEEEFGWRNYRIPMPASDDFLDKFGAAYEIPAISLAKLCQFFKEKSQMQVVQIVGNPEMQVKRVGVLVGGGSLGLGIENLPMRYMQKHRLDLAICGDITEWTLTAYIRDASQLGLNKAMLVLGHERSEEPGMKHMPAWMSSITGEIEVKFIDAGEPFLYL